ncbi:MAG: excinuclease ABC subunit UvrC [Nitrospinota bacterium]|nr:excinuclease ABC subunit UvrC [Nitrospinota bacterium]
MEDQFAHLRPTLDSLPGEPGVYIMKDADDVPLYIGKAKSLKSRVRSYFQPSAAHSPRIAVMVSRVRSVDFIVTTSELEALILEDNLVKKEQPPYNVMLRDDKNFPYLKLTMEEAFPRLILVRKRIKDGGRYFGPYVSAKSVRGALRLVYRIFHLRQTKDNLEGKPPRRPCLNFQMGRCLAPCAHMVTRQEYAQEVERVALFLKGRDEELLKELESKMAEAAAAEQFEVAARYRDQVASIRKLNEKQAITNTGMTDEDVIAAVEGGGRIVVKLFQVRGGKMNAERDFTFDKMDRLDMDETLSAFIRQFYTSGMEIPPTVVVNLQMEEMEPLSDLLSVRRGSKAQIVTPERGRKRSLVEMAENNARIKLGVRLDTEEARAEALAQIQKALGMAAPPEVMEAYDISNTSGTATVGSQVVFVQGEPDKSRWRKYKIATVTGPDDYASMAEVMRRRFRRVMDGVEAAPSLLLIDGGKGQVGAVMEAVRQAGVDNPPPILGVAKGEDRENTETDVFHLAGGAAPVSFQGMTAGRFMLQRMRDEAHRFAVTYHKKLRDGTLTRSMLDEIPGIGPKRKKVLLKKFGSVKKIKEAGAEQIAEALGVGVETARKMWERL